MEIYDAYGKRKAEKFYVVISFFCIHLDRVGGGD